MIPATSNMQARVAITGVGLVTPLGLTAAENVERSRTLASAIGAVRDVDTTRRSFQAAAYVPPFAQTASLRCPKNDRFMTRSVTFASGMFGSTTP